MIHVGVVAVAMPLRVGLREVLNSLPDVSVVAEAAHPEELNVRGVDILVLTGSFDPEALEKTTPLLLLTEDPSDAQLLFALTLPAWGVLSVNASEDELAAALAALAQGLWVGAPSLMRDLLLRKPAPLDEPDAAGESLTARETEVLQLTAQGLPNKQIALVLGISEHTIKFHLSSLYAKLGVTSRTEAVRAGARRGLVVL